MFAILLYLISYPQLCSLCFNLIVCLEPLSSADSRCHDLSVQCLCSFKSVTCKREQKYVWHAIGIDPKLLKQLNLINPVRLSLGTLLRFNPLTKLHKLIGILQDTQGAKCRTYSLVNIFQNVERERF